MLRVGISICIRNIYIFKGGCSLEVSGSDGNNCFWEVSDDRVVEELKENDDIGLRVFCFYKGAYKIGRA